MHLVFCCFCGDQFERANNKFNENKKRYKNSYCSQSCQSQARIERRIFACERVGCGNEFLRQRSAVSTHNYCSRSCMAIVNNRLYPRKTRPVQKCANKTCEKVFKKSAIYCSPKCQNVAARRYTASELIVIIKKKANKLERTPAKREMLAVAGSAINTFGSWNNAIRTAGLVPYRSASQRMYKRTRTTAHDGHSCDSISEAIIDNWLTDQGIAHQRDLKYPGTKHKADWGIGERTFVEYFGLANDSPRYDREIKKKRAICKKHDILLIEIYPTDLYPVIRLKEKLSLYEN